MKTVLRRHIHWLLLGLLALAWGLALPAPARARAVVVRSAPADGAVLNAAPSQLQLWFDHAAIIEPDAVTLADARGNAVATTGLHSAFYQPAEVGLQHQFDPTFLFLCSVGLNSYPTSLTVQLPALAPGTYRLSWQTIAINDRQTTSGTLVFAIDPSAPPTLTDPNPLALSLSGQADDLMVTMEVRPNRPGANFISVQTAPLRRPLSAPIQQVRLRLTPPDAAPREVAAVRSADGRFHVVGDLIDRPGEWQVAVLIGRSDLRTTTLPLTWTVPGEDAPVPTWALASLGGAVLVASGSALIWRRRRARQG
jgi:methionine-rich copper-binding protein CopC